MQKVSQQSQAGYHYEGWKSNTIENTENEKEGENNAGANGGSLLHFCKRSFLYPRSALPTFS
jgi:hypothetical protein